MTARRAGKRRTRRRAIKRKNPIAKAVKRIAPKVKPAKRRPPPSEAEWESNES